jgi:hypothetical protein
VIEHRHGEAVGDVLTASQDGPTPATGTVPPVAWRPIGTAELARQLAYTLDVHAAPWDVEVQVAELLREYARYPPARRAAARWQARPSGRLAAAVIQAHAQHDAKGERCVEAPQ